MKNKYALIGEKLSHSYSPMIQNLLFKLKHVDAEYSLIECQKDDLKGKIDDLRNGIYSGYNVTIPYKQEIMKYIDEIDEHAKKINAVNTIVFRNGKVIGYNTDYYGFMKQLEYFNIDVEDKNCYILGTGGSSKALYQGLIDLKANVLFVSRNQKNQQTISYDMLEKSDIDVLINATPIGMFPNDDCPVNDAVLNKAKIVTDIIFNPKQTKLLKSKECFYNGLPMLFYQAEKAQEIWLEKTFSIHLKEIFNQIWRCIYHE